VTSRQELSELVESGVSPDELRDLLIARVDAAAGTLLGCESGPGEGSPVRLLPAQRLKPVLIAGRTGSGKTTLLRHLISQDMEAGAGLAVVAPEAEMITEEILPFVPRARWDDVVLIDPSDCTRPIPFNPLHLDAGEDLDRKAEELTTIFRRAWAEGDGTGAPRMELILGRTVDALLPIPGTTLLDIEPLLDRQDPTFRRWVIDHTSDERVRHFWASTYESYPKDAGLSLINRLGRFLRSRFVRNLLCRPGESFNIRRAMDEGRIVLVNLSDGLLGEETASVLGQLFVAKLQIAAMSRADIPAHARRPFYGYLDEWQRTASVAASSYEQIFARARKYRLGLTLGLQHFGQVPEALMRDILANVGTSVIFQVGATDARRLSHELIGEANGTLVPVHPAELVSLPVGHAVCRIGRTLLRLKTLPPPEHGSEETRDEVIRRSRARYGVDVSADRVRKPNANGQAIAGLNPSEVF
jgi:energy-coupling factor transporter ATP-binding protein EcfA2